MDFLKNLILQWINCLQDDVSDHIESIAQINDEKIYYKLIDKIKFWNQKDHNISQKDMVLQFIKDEYPNVVFSDKKNSIENLYFATLILSRLSLEPLFHKSLCSNLPLEMQVKIKSILESIYTLGKDVTVEDLYKILSISDKTNDKLNLTKPKYLLEEFLNSPIIRTEHVDNKIHEQTRQLRTLKAKVETLHYEKSELIEDIKIQQNQIQELQNKLHKVALDLKLPLNDNLKIDNLNCSCQLENIKLMQSSYEKELKSLENYITELQNSNSHLQIERNDLIKEIKIYKTKCCILQERNVKNDQKLELTLLETEKKEEELIELKIKYEELYNYLKENYKICVSNDSFDLDDKGIFNTSLNKSETLSSVIEIQLQDTKQELIIVQNKFKIINILFTVIMEEYKKLKGKVDILHINDIEINEKNILQQGHYHLIEKQSIVNNLKNDYSFIQDEITNLSVNVFQKDFTKVNEKSYFLDILNIFDNFKSSKRLKSNIIFKLNKVKNIVNDIIIDCNTCKIEERSVNFLNLNILNKFQNKYDLKINNIDKNILFLKFNFFDKTTWCNQIKFYITMFHKMSMIEKNDSIDKLLFSIINSSDTIDTKGYFKLFNFIKNNFEINLKLLNFNECSLRTNIKCNYEFNNDIFDIIKNSKVEYLKYNTTTNKYNIVSLKLSQYDLKSLKSAWIFLFKSIYNNIQICKLLLLLEKRWIFTLKILKDIYGNSQTKLKFKQLIIEKDLIKSELKHINFENFQILSLKLITIVQFVTMLNKNYYNEIKLNDDNLLFNIHLKNRIINIKKQMDNFNYLLKLYKKNVSMHNLSNKVIGKKNKKNLNVLIGSNKNTSISNKGEKIVFQNDDIYHLDKLLNNVNYNQPFQHYLKEIHEKYKLKLEKMKEKIKSVYNSQITLMKKEQEIMTKTQLEALESKIKCQYYNHSEELKKYKEHISEITKQLWHVGDKLLNEKQEKEAMIKKFQDLKMNYETNEIKNQKHQSENYNNFTIKLEPNHNILQSVKSNSINKLHTLRGFQIMANAFSNEDEEEVFDTTYLSDMQRSEHTPTHDLNRLSILQMRNAKCKPHLKSSYPAELQFNLVPFTEEEIKTGLASEELFNDSLSRSLLTGKKVKRKDRTRNTIDTPQRSLRFSNIFRKHRLATNRK